MSALIELVLALAGIGGLRVWRRSRMPVCARCARRYRPGSHRIQLVPVDADRAVWLCQSCLRATAYRANQRGWLR